MKHGASIAERNDAGRDRTVVEGDINGDGRANLPIQLRGNLGLNAHDFVLRGVTP